jgi:hypothetical protein
MPREIVSQADANAAAPVASNTSNPNNYKDRLVKLIPSEIVTGYITLQGLISGRPGNNTALFTSIAFISLLILTPFYLKNISGVSKTGQIIFTSIAFIIWVMASGGFHYIFPEVKIFDDNFLGSMLLIIYTLAIPFVYKG